MCDFCKSVKNTSDMEELKLNDVFDGNPCEDFVLTIFSYAEHKKQEARREFEYLMELERLSK